MNPQTALRLSCAALLLTLSAACNGFFTDEPTTPPATVVPKFAFVANSGDGNVSAYTVNSSSGALAAVTGSPFAAGTTPRTAGADSAGKFLYVANEDGGVSGYTIDRTTGALVAIAGSPFAAGTTPTGVAVDPTARFVYVANNGSGDVSGFTANSTTGVLASVGATTAAGVNPLRLREDPSGRFLYVASGAGGVFIFSINQTSGVLTFGVLTFVANVAGADSRDVLVDATGKFAYVADGGNGVSNGGRVNAYAVNASTGELTAITGSPFTAGTTSVALATDSAGKFLFVANQGSNNVSAFKINANGTLTAVGGSPFGGLAAPVSLSVAPGDKFLYVANSTGGTSVSIFTIDSTTGALAAAGSASAGTGPSSVVATK